MVFLPGFGGSWNTLDLINNSANGTWKKTPFIKVYNNLKNTFLSAGYIENQNYFEFYYDWRKRLDSLTDDLNQYLINNVYPSLPPETKVDLVGHSFGGLIARAFAQKYHPQELDQVVTSGSPHQGAIPAYLGWSGAQLKEGNNWETLGLSLYLYLHRGSSYSPVEIIRNLSPSLQDLLPTYDFAQTESGTTIQFTQMETVNSSLINLNQSLTPTLQEIISTLAGFDQNSIRWLILGNRTLSDKLLNRWPDGRVINYLYSQEGDGTVLLNSALLPLTHQVTNSLSHIELAQTTTGIDAIMSELGIIASAQTGHEQANLTPGLMFLVRSPAQITVTVPGGGQAGHGVANPIPNSLYSPEDKLLLIYNAQSGQYQVTISGTGTGEYHLDIGQLTDNGNYWNTLIGQTSFGETTDWLIDFQPDQPLNNPLVFNNDDYFNQARQGVENLIEQSTDIRLKKYLDRILKLLDRRPTLTKLALTSMYKFRFWVDRFDNSNPQLKAEADQIGQWLETIFVNQNQNKQINPKTVKAEISSTQKIINNLEKRLSKLNGTNPIIGNTWQLIENYFDQAQNNFSQNNLWQAHADIFIVRVLILEILGLIN